MAKGEGAESGSAAGLLPTSILQASERPAQVKVRSRETRGGGPAGIWAQGRRRLGLALGHFGVTGYSEAWKNQSSRSAPGPGSDGEILKPLCTTLQWVCAKSGAGNSKRRGALPSALGSTVLSHASFSP